MAAASGSGVNVESAMKRAAPRKCTSAGAAARLSKRTSERRSARVRTRPARHRVGSARTCKPPVKAGAFMGSLAPFLCAFGAVGVGIAHCGFCRFSRSLRLARIRRERGLGGIRCHRICGRATGEGYGNEGAKAGLANRESSEARRGHGGHGWDWGRRKIHELDASLGVSMVFRKLAHFSSVFARTLISATASPLI